MSIPTTDAELATLLPKLPRRLQYAVSLWCFGNDVAWLFEGLAPSTLYRDKRILAELSLDLSEPHPAPFRSEPAETVYYCIQIHAPADATHAGVWHLAEKSDLFLSPHGRLAGLQAAAHLDSHSLALALAEHCMPRLQKRSTDIKYAIHESRCHSERQIEARVRADSKAVTDYLQRNEKFPRR